MLGNCWRKDTGLCASDIIEIRDRSMCQGIDGNMRHRIYVRELMHIRDKYMCQGDVRYIYMCPVINREKRHRFMCQGIVEDKDTCLCVRKLMDIRHRPRCHRIEGICINMFSEICTGQSVRLFILYIRELRE